MMASEKVDKIIEHFAEINEKEDYVWGYDTSIETVEEARNFVKKELNEVYNQALEDVKENVYCLNKEQQKMLFTILEELKSEGEE